MLRLRAATNRSGGRGSDRSLCGGSGTLLRIPRFAAYNVIRSAIARHRLPEPFLRSGQICSGRASTIQPKAGSADQANAQTDGTAAETILSAEVGVAVVATVYGVSATVHIVAAVVAQSL